VVVTSSVDDVGISEVVVVTAAVVVVVSASVDDASVVLTSIAVRIKVHTPISYH